MSWLNRLKVFFNKENLNYSEGYVDPYEFHKTFYKLAKIFRVVDNEPIPKWTILVPILVYISGVSAGILFVICTIHSIAIFDIFLITEAGTYVSVMIYKLLIITCTVFQKPQYHSLFQALREDFKYICGTGSKYREKFFRNHMWTWKATILSAVFIMIIGGGMMVCAKLALIIFLAHRPEGVARPLPFPLWYYDVDFGKTPTYEFFFVLSDVWVIGHCSAYIFMMQTQIVWIRQIMSRADVIIWTLEDLLVDIQPAVDVQQKELNCKVIKKRMAHIMKMHHSLYSLMDAYAAVYKKTLVLEQIIGAPIVCLTAFCSVQKLDDGEFPGILMLLGTSVITVYFIPSYLCTILGEKVQSIRDACWDTPFWNCPGTVICPYYVLIMQRTLRSLPIQSHGFADVTLETFADRMTFAYSGFNMLRQSNFDI